MEKQCTRCKQLLPATKKFFYANKKNKDGLYFECKKCNSERNRDWYNKNKPTASGVRKEKNMTRWKQSTRFTRDTYSWLGDNAIYTTGSILDDDCDSNLIAKIVQGRL